MNEAGVDIFDGNQPVAHCKWDEIINFDANIVTNDHSSSRLTVTRMATLGIFSLAAPKKTGKIENKFFYVLHTTTGDFEVEAEMSGSAKSSLVGLAVATLKKQANIGRAYVANHATGQRNDVPGKQDNGLDELEKLAQLKKQGVITQTEFEAKKKQILGL